MEQKSVEDITAQLALRQKSGTIPVICNISNRHTHVPREYLDKLFGVGYELSVKNKLMQSDKFVVEETVKITGLKGGINKVQLLGPVGKVT